MTTAISEDAMLGLANRFRVEVGGVDLGSWAKCDGLKVDFKTEKRLSGGEYDRVYFLPKQIEYGTITLARAMTAKDSPKLRGWLSDRADEYNSVEGNLGYTDGTAKIVLYDAHGVEVIAWDLRNVHIESWAGPSFDASSSKVAVETLKLNHEGFL